MIEFRLPDSGVGCLERCHAPLRETSRVDIFVSTRSYVDEFLAFLTLQSSTAIGQTSGTSVIHRIRHIPEETFIVLPAMFPDLLSIRPGIGLDKDLFPGNFHPFYPAVRRQISSCLLLLSRLPFFWLSSSQVRNYRPAT